MIKLRDIAFFLSGAVFFHTLSHIMLPYFFTMPLDVDFMTLTSQLNTIIIMISAILTVALLWWAIRLK